MGPFRQEVVLDEPDTFKSHLLSEPHLIDDFPNALVFRLRGGRPGNLYLIEQTEFHAVFPLSEATMPMPIPATETLLQRRPGMPF